MAWRDRHRRKAGPGDRRASFLGRLFRRQRGIPMDSEKPSTRDFPGGIETSQSSGATMTSGWIILARSKPNSDTIGVFVIPPGTRTLTVTPVPSGPLP